MGIPKTIKISLLLIIFLGIFQSLASADTPPTQPCWVFGTVKINGEYVSLGTPIYAMMDGVTVADTTAIESTEGAGDSVYVLQIPYQENIDGDLIEFFVDGLKAKQTAVWQNLNPIELNLTAEGMVFLPLILR